MPSARWAATKLTRRLINEKLKVKITKSPQSFITGRLGEFFILLSLPFTLYTLYFILYTLHFTLYTLHFTPYSLHFTLYTFTPYSFKILNQSASIQPLTFLPAGSAATNPIFAPIHLPWRISKAEPASCHFLPSVE